jgi:hypothetical protein
MPRFFPIRTAAGIADSRPAIRDTHDFPARRYFWNS